MQGFSERYAGLQREREGGREDGEDGRTGRKKWVRGRTRAPENERVSEKEREERSGIFAQQRDAKTLSEKCCLPLHRRNSADFQSHIAQKKPTRIQSFVIGMPIERMYYLHPVEGRGVDVCLDEILANLWAQHFKDVAKSPENREVAQYGVAGLIHIFDTKHPVECHDAANYKSFLTRAKKVERNRRKYSPSSANLKEGLPANIQSYQGHSITFKYHLNSVNNEVLHLLQESMKSPIADFPCTIQIADSDNNLKESVASESVASKIIHNETLYSTFV